MNKFCKPLLIIFLMITLTNIAFAFSPKDSETGNWQTYLNSRYEYSVSYPDFLIAKEEADNGDGKQIISKDNHFKLSVYGSHYLPNKNIGDNIQQLIKEEKPDNSKITYMAMGENWFVLSGLEKTKQIFYIKTFVGKSATNTVYIEYPKAEKRKYDTLSVDIIKTFQPHNLNHLN